MILLLRPDQRDERGRLQLKRQEDPGHAEPWVCEVVLHASLPESSLQDVPVYARCNQTRGLNRSPD